MTACHKPEVRRVDVRSGDQVSRVLPTDFQGDAKDVCLCSASERPAAVVLNKVVVKCFATGGVGYAKKVKQHYGCSVSCENKHS